LARIWASLLIYSPNNDIELNHLYDMTRKSYSLAADVGGCWVLEQNGVKANLLCIDWRDLKSQLSLDHEQFTSTAWTLINKICHFVGTSTAIWRI
jgi:hypothetical protein